MCEEDTCYRRLSPTSPFSVLYVSSSHWMLVLSNCAMFVLHITRSLSCRNCGCWWQVPRISKLFDAWLLWSSSGLPATVCGSSGHMSHPCIAPDQDLDECRAVLHNWQPTNSSRCARIIRCFGFCKALVIKSKQSSMGFTLLLEGVCGHPSRQG